MSLDTIPTSPAQLPIVSEASDLRLGEKDTSASIASLTPSGSPASNVLLEMRKEVTNNAVLLERGGRHGPAVEQFDIAQEIKAACRRGRSWENLHSQQKEIVEMLATKLSRIVSGDPMYVDHWSDLKGYSEIGEILTNGGTI